MSEQNTPTIEMKELSKLAVTAVLLSVANQQQAFQAVTADVLIDMGLNPKDGWQVYAPQGSVPFVGRSVAAPAPDAV